MKNRGPSCWSERLKFSVEKKLDMARLNRDLGGNDRVLLVHKSHKHTTFSASYDGIHVEYSIVKLCS
jgi:hypothetical protein